MFVVVFFGRETKNSMEADDEGKIVRILEKADPAKQESLDAENVVDPMDAEQTWPTAEELRLADEEQKKVCCNFLRLKSYSK